MSTPDILADLTEPQQRAVGWDRGPILVLAGAGSGKTRVITRRVARLLDDGAPPQSILAVTFTNKAAGEMRERVAQLVGSTPVWIATFHAACARLLRNHGAPLGIPREFTIYDADDQKQTLRSALQEAKLDPRHWRPPEVLAAIRLAKRELVTARAFQEKVTGYHEEGLARAYVAYEEALAQAGALDFDDLLMRAVLLLEQEEGLRALLQQRLTHILVDEFQDTNAAQYQLLRLLAPPGGDLCVTGDPDQSIYSWRGAEIRNILRFPEEYEPTEVIRLEQNYRSTRTILAAANAVIERNAERIPKALWTENPEGEPVRVVARPDELEEARGVAGLIEDLHAAGRAWREFAIFYRTNVQSRAFEEVLSARRIPHVVVGGLAFYQRAPVKNLLSYLRLTHNPRDTVSFTRAVTTPRRGIGPRTIEAVVALARARSISLVDVLTSPEALAELPSRGRQSLTRFGEIMAALTSLPRSPTERLVVEAATLSGYEDALQAAEDTDALEHLQQLQRAAAEFDRSSPDGALADWLETTTLWSDVDEQHGVHLGTVTLMTVHAAKGLEFPVVFVTGLEDGLFPLEGARERPEGQLEEERRLMYVAMTRARELLFLTRAGQRARYGRTDRAFPSRFLQELPTRLLTGDPVHAPPSLPRHSALWGSLRSRRSRGEEEDLAVDPFALDDEDLGDAPLEEGDRVAHRLYGSGRVVRILGGMTPKVVVEFDEAGERTVLLRYGELRRDVEY